MDAHLIDSAVFGHQWSTPESRRLLAEPARIGRWVEVLAALAGAQAEVGLIPESAAAAIAGLRDRTWDGAAIEAIAAGTRRTSHSTLGMIDVLKEALPAEAAEWVYYGATVQDVTDTAQVLEVRAVGRLLWRDLRRIEAALLELARRHRDTPMVGRTHGQPGAPITFGFKAATWADEIGRCLDRLAQGRDRWLVGQLAGAVGVLGFFGSAALPMQQSYVGRLGLAQPPISWLSTRDRLAEFAQVVASTVTALARVANETYALARAEIGELREPVADGTVGSITMPHKRNPEVSEQVVTLARLVRSQSAVLTETMVGEHERDGRTWKTEWVLVPELAHYALAATAMSVRLVEGLEVDTDRMLANLTAGGSASSERLLSLVSVRLGKHRGQAALQEAYRVARSAGVAVVDALDLTEEETAELDRIHVGAAGEMVDRVLARAAERRDALGEDWA